MAKLAEAVVSIEQVEELKAMWAKFGFKFHIKDSSNFTGSHVRVYLYEHFCYSESCGIYHGKTSMVNGWDQSDETESYGYNDFVQASIKELEACG